MADDAQDHTRLVIEDEHGIAVVKRDLLFLIMETTPAGTFTVATVRKRSDAELFASALRWARCVGPEPCEHDSH